LFPQTDRQASKLEGVYKIVVFIIYNFPVLQETGNIVNYELNCSIHAPNLIYAEKERVKLSNAKQWDTE
jgi:hypothetical protein